MIQTLDAVQETGVQNPGDSGNCRFGNRGSGNHAIHEVESTRLRKPCVSGNCKLAIQEPHASANHTIQETPRFMKTCDSGSRASQETRFRKPGQETIRKTSRFRDPPGSNSTARAATGVPRGNLVWGAVGGGGRWAVGRWGGWVGGWLVVLGMLIRSALHPQ